jgi:hypothetical protein
LFEGGAEGGTPLTMENYYLLLSGREAPLRVFI